MPRHRRIIKNNTADIKTSLASGGSAANTMHGLAKMGMEAGFIGSVGMMKQAISLKRI